MQEQLNLLDELHTQISTTPPYFNRKKIWAIAIAVLCVSIVADVRWIQVSRRFDQNQIYAPSLVTRIWAVCVLNYIILPVAAFIISLGVSAVPFKKLSYRKKYFPFFLIALFVLYSLEFLYFILPIKAIVDFLK